MVGTGAEENYLYCGVFDTLNIISVLESGPSSIFRQKRRFNLIGPLERDNLTE
jgi:hypothetical protein